MILATGRRGRHTTRRSTCPAPSAPHLAVAAVASALALSPAALAGGVTPDNSRRPHLPRHGRASRRPDPRRHGQGPAGRQRTVRVDTTGVGLIHASMVNAQVAARAALAVDGHRVPVEDAGIGAVAGFGTALAGAGLAAGVRSRARIVA